MAEPDADSQDHDDSHEDHDDHEDHVARFRDRFWWSLALTVPTLVWGDLLQTWLGYSAPVFPGSEYVSPVFGTAVFVYGGRVFLKGAVDELKDRLPGMMTLIALAITVAFAFSLAVTFGFPGTPLWWELATLVTIMLLGHWIEMRSVSRASGALKELAELMPSTARRVTEGDETEEVPLDELEDGDIVLVRPGDSIPADGTVVKGESSVNESMVTGESRPIGKGEGDEVIGGTVNQEGSLRVEVTGTGDETTLAGIMGLVEEAQRSKSRAQNLADRAAFWLTVVAVSAAILTAAVWLIAGATGQFTIQRVVTVLVIACPHALGLAIPLVVAISTTLGARNGLLVRDRRGLEEARKLDAVIFDKTGTLTRGEFRVVGIETTGLSDDEALRLAAGAERDSEHTIAAGIVESAREEELEIPSSEDFENIPGHGIRATVEGRALHVGGPALLDELDAEPPEALRTFREEAAGRGQAVVYLIEEGEPIAAFAVADAIRDESRDAIRALHDAGIEVVMLTGDAQAVADAVAGELDIDTVFAEVLPDDKAAKVEELQAQGKEVAMVGDGVNDAPALVTADVGIAIGAGTDVAVESGDVVLVRSDPRDVPRIVELSKATYRKMIQNLWWAAGYNIIALPLAAGVLVSWGILLHPAVGAILMSMSTVIVAANAQLLRRKSL
jgi:Cu2+-exporting ATPase